MKIDVGEVFSAERTITAEDVATFARLSGDHGRHHLQPDAEGRLVAHGLLTAMIPIDIVAGEPGKPPTVSPPMNFDFVVVDASAAKTEKMPRKHHKLRKLIVKGSSPGAGRVRPNNTKVAVTLVQVPKPKPKHKKHK